MSVSIMIHLFKIFTRIKSFGGCTDILFWVACLCKRDGCKGRFDCTWTSTCLDFCNTLLQICCQGYNHEFKDDHEHNVTMIFMWGQVEAISVSIVQYLHNIMLNIIVWVFIMIIQHLQYGIWYNFVSLIADIYLHSDLQCSRTRII